MKSGCDEVSASLPDLWLSAWTRPWAVLGGWNALWSDWNGSWQRWLGSMAAMPAAWMPALAVERHGQTEAIDFFLPWLPRLETETAPVDSHSDDAPK